MAGPYSIGSDHFPGVSKLIEELGELVQALGKLIATDGERNPRRGTERRQRRHQVGVRLLRSEFVRLQAVADRDGVSPAEAPRRAFFGDALDGAS